MSERDQTAPLGQESSRRLYRAPELIRVRLDADQVLAIGCKTTKKAARLAPACHVNGCSALGS